MAKQNNVLEQNNDFNQKLVEFTAERIKKLIEKKETEIKKGLIDLKEEPIKTKISTREKGMYGEKLAEVFFRQCGWEVKIAKNVGSAYDMLVSNGKETYAVNVKFGEHFTIKIGNILNLFKVGITPAFLLISMNKKYVFLIPEIIEKVER